MAVQFVQPYRFSEQQFARMAGAGLIPRVGDDYEHAHPTHEDALVLVEVADSSVRYDRQIKSERYAQAGIPEYWLVDLTRNRIVVHERPVGGAYQAVRACATGESWRSAALNGPEVRVNDVLKPR